MANLTKRLFVFINVVALVIFLPGIAIAAPVQLNVTSSVIVAQPIQTATDSFSDNSLTPQQSQQLQAVRQRRNREINAVLNTSQRTQLSNKLRAGKNINEALETLNLQPEQQELVEAILKFTNLKMKAISSRYSLTIR
ncbi:hypothetical protein WKK05_20135 [Nostoc sp. UHCC 0302]|uniref:hypothetical protein n=1 Tax=Nostoc sp. UHCC 0302 TaxID=3134896 RepID=UPI00311CC8FD